VNERNRDDLDDAVRPARKLVLFGVLALVLVTTSGTATGQMAVGASGKAAGRLRVDPDAAGEHVPILVDVEHLGLLGLAQSGVDSDGDGLSDVDEVDLETDPGDVDSDCDGLDDGTEVGVDVLDPIDSDSDGIIDALESRWVNSDGVGANDDVDPGLGEWQVSCGKFIPFAVKNDLSDSTRLEVRITAGPAITQVLVDSSAYVGDVFVDAVAVPDIGGVELFDDGTHGDRVARDRIFTRDGFTSSAVTNRVTDRDFDLVTVTGELSNEIFDMDAVVGGSFDRFRQGIVDADQVEAPLPLAPKVQIVSNLANLIDPLASLEVKKFLMPASSSLQLATQAFYTEFGDDYDLIMMFPESPAVRGSFGTATQAQNQVQGIGRSIFDNSTFWGSAGKLGSVMCRNFGNNGPTLHEFMHRWGVSLSSTLGLQQCAGGHWGIAGVGESQLGGFDSTTLIDEGGGEYTVGYFGRIANGGDSVNYGMLELYLAGLASPDEVPDFPVPLNVDCNSLACDDPSCTRMRFSADAVVNTSVDSIITAHGSRIPDWTTAQTDFKAALVVFSQYPLNGSEMAYYNIQSADFGGPDGAGFPKSFAEATLGRGSMDTIMIPEPSFMQQLASGVALLFGLGRRRARS
jgi:hypothetical protein